MILYYSTQGITLILDLISVYGLDVVQAYMGHIQNNAELAVRQMLKDFGEKLGKHTLTSHDYMDDGTKIQLKVTIQPKDGSAIFDFTCVHNFHNNEILHRHVVSIKVLNQMLSFI